MKNVLILTCNSAGAGHFIASQAIKKVLKNKAKVKIIDFYKTTSPFIESLMGSYGFVARNLKPVYRLLYDLFEIKPNDRFVNLFIYELTKEKTADIIKKEKPDLVINVHSYSGRSFLEYLSANKVSIPVWNIIMDPITFHKSWLDKRYNLTLVGTKEAYNKTIKHVPKSKIKILGTILHPKFYKKSLSKNALRKKYKLSKNKPVILFTGGGDGIGYNEKIIRKILKRKIDADIIAICGKNAKLYKKIRRYPIYVVGFTKNINEYLKMADVIVGKAGPGTLVEAMLYNVPIVMTHYVYGQEKGNVDYITKNKLGILSKNVDETVDILDNVCKGKIKFNNNSKYRLDRKSIFVIRDMVLKHLYGIKPLN